MMKENCYLTYAQARTACGAKVEIDYRYLPARLRNYEINTGSMDNESPLDGFDSFYCVGYDGRIGVTSDNGCSVQWFAFSEVA